MGMHHCSRKANVYWRSNRTNTILFAWMSDLEMADIRDFFSWESSSLLLSKTGRPVISINVATPENNVKYVATTYIDIRQKYLKLFAFTFIPLRVCGVALHGVVRYVAWHVVACCVVCHVACHCMLCGMASWDMLCGMVRYAMWHGMAWYAL